MFHVNNINRFKSLFLKKTQTIKKFAIFTIIINNTSIKIY